MKRWDHFYISCTVCKETADALEAAGVIGWELVAVVYAGEIRAGESNQ
jgi:hypothetical protein